MAFTFNGPEPFPVDQSLVSSVGESIQSQERLDLLLRRKFPSSESEDEAKIGLKKESTEVLEKLREMKSKMEASNFDFQPLTLNLHGNNLLDLKQLTQMHIPSSLTEDVKQKFNELIEKLFEGKCKRVLSSVLLACPWYRASQRERGEQARYNTVFVVFVSQDKDFFSAANHHMIDQSDVLDLGWLYAVELYHFAHCFVRGKSRFFEALYCQQGALLFAHEQWRQLRNMLTHSSVMGLRGFVEQCKGQAFGGVAKKHKSGKVGMRGNITLRDFCESLRLLHHLVNLGKGQGPCTDDLDLENLPPQGQEALSKLQALYKSPEISKQEIFDLILSWRDDIINNELKAYKFTPVAEVEGIVGKWLTEVRIQGQQLILPKEITGDDHCMLLCYREKIGGPLRRMKPEQIIMITQAGSHMYGLSTPDSDVDYVVIYREETQTILSACKRLSEIHENRGPNKDFEYGAYEVRTFCEMLLKCSVVMLELLFVEQIEYSSPEWKALAKHRESFITEKTLQQFLGLIKNNFHSIKSKKHVGTSRERKLFYQIFHKLESLNHMIDRKVPPVTCTGGVKEFIMNVRKGNNEGEFSRSNLLTRATNDYEDFRDRLAIRKSRLTESPDYRLVNNWLMSVRGIQ